MTNGFLSVSTDGLDLDTLDTDTHKATQNQDPDTTKDTEADTSPQNWKKRYSDQQRYVTQLKNEKTVLEQEIVKLREKPLDLPTTKEELDAFKRDHPALANNIISLLRLEVSERDKDLTEKLKNLDKKDAAVNTEAKIQEVLKVHPDAKRIKASQEFADWFALQSPGTRALFESIDPQDWVRGINIYKEDAGIQTAKSKKTDAATAVNQTSSTDTKPDNNKKVWKSSEVAAMSDSEYDLNRDIIIKAKTENRYINDLPH